MKSENQVIEEIFSLKNRVKPGGLFVEYRHFRFLDAWAAWINPMGGYTLAYVVDGEFAHIGIADCSDLDNFNKNTGRVISSTKALENPVTITIGRLHNLLAHGNDAWSFWRHEREAWDVQEAIHGKDRYKTK